MVFMQSTHPKLFEAFTLVYQSFETTPVPTSFQVRENRTPHEVDLAELALRDELTADQFTEFVLEEEGEVQHSSLGLRLAAAILDDYFGMGPL